MVKVTIIFLIRQKSIKIYIFSICFSYFQNIPQFLRDAKFFKIKTIERK